VAVARLTPTRTAGAIERGRLFDTLDTGVRGPLTLVTGPAGAGKTVLLSTWLAQRTPFATVAWLALERGDASPPRFWRATLDAVRHAGDDSLAALDALVPGDDGELLAALAQALAGRAAPLVLVLDDFHELRSAEVWAALDGLLRHPPAGLRLVIASRSDPPLACHRLRVEGRLVELRAADLAFTPAEAADLFAAVGVSLSDRQVDLLHARTEGWAAGLRLAALSLPEGSDADAVINRFAGDDGAVADYLVGEVLRQQARAVRDFMLRTSVVDTLTPDLANALTGRRDGGDALATLARSGAFVTELDGARTSYRYHGLFVELLRAELRYRMPETYRLGHRRAARWFAAQRQDRRAIVHAMAAADWPAAVGLLASSWFALLVDGDADELVRLLAELPPQIAETDPELMIAGAAASFELGRAERGDDYLALAERASTSVPPHRRSDFALARSIVSLLRARVRGDYAAVRSAARKVLAGYGDAHVRRRDRRALALLHLGVADRWGGDTRRARGHLDDALALARLGGCEYLQLCALSELALLEAALGRLRRGRATAEEAVTLAGRRAWTERPQIAPAFLALAVAAHLGGDRAADYVERAARAAGPPADRALRTFVELVRAITALADGELDVAARFARAAAHDEDSWTMPSGLAAATAAAEARALAAAGDQARARAVLGEARRSKPALELDLVHARLALAEGDHAGARRRLARGLDAEVVALHPSSRVELRVLAAVATHLAGDPAGALEMIEAALVLAQPEGYLRPFLAVGPPLPELLARRIRAGTAHRALAGEILAVLQRPAGPQRPRGMPLLEPLSDREAAVLRYLPTQLSKAEIATEMFVSVNTVKTHVKNIYRKLDVASRGEAVRRAKALQLV